MIRQILNNKHFKYGVPFFSLIVGAPFIIKDFQQVKFDYTGQKKFNEEFNSGLENKGIDKHDVTPEEVYESYMKKEYQDDYEQVRGPRPWEEQPNPQNKGNKIVAKVHKPGSLDN